METLRCNTGTKTTHTYKTLETNTITNNNTTIHTHPADRRRELSLEPGLEWTPTLTGMTCSKRASRKKSKSCECYNTHQKRFIAPFYTCFKKPKIIIGTQIILTFLDNDVLQHKRFSERAAMLTPLKMPRKKYSVFFVFMTLQTHMLSHGLKAGSHNTETN